MAKKGDDAVERANLEDFDYAKLQTLFGDALIKRRIQHAYEQMASVMGELFSYKRAQGYCCATVSCMRKAEQGLRTYNGRMACPGHYGILKDKARYEVPKLALSEYRALRQYERKEEKDRDEAMAKEREAKRLTRKSGGSTTHLDERRRKRDEAMAKISRAKAG